MPRSSCSACTIAYPTCFSLSPFEQLEIDYKAECHGGDLVESLASRCGEPLCSFGCWGSLSLELCSRAVGCGVHAGWPPHQGGLDSVVKHHPCPHPTSPPSASLADTPEVLTSNGAGPGALSFVHMLRRCQGDKVAELVRCRTTWRAGEAAAASSS